MSTTARSLMYALNPFAVQAEEHGWQIFVEDAADADGRVYRIEYRCAADGANAFAYLLYNPWGPTNPLSYEQSHLGPDGFICYGVDIALPTTPDERRSPYDIGYAVQRTRFWVNGYSFLREHGYAATKEAIPEW